MPPAEWEKARMLLLTDSRREIRPVAAAAPARLTAEAFALALVAAAGLQVMENLLPRLPFFPWMRLGLSYAIVLPFLLRYGVVPALALLAARNGMSLLFGGQPFSTFLIGTGSGLASFLALGGMIRWACSRRLLGLAGAGILLATGFNAAQLALVKWTLIRHGGFFVQAGPMLAWSLASGALVSALIRLSEKEIGEFLSGPVPRQPDGEPASGAGASGHPGLPEGRTSAALASLAALGALILTPSLAFQAAGFTLLAAVSGSKGWRLLRQGWPYFLFLAWLHLLRTPGTLVIGDWITREGLDAFALHALRLANVMLAGRQISEHLPWRPLASRESLYLRGFFLALPLMPTLFPRSLAAGREMLAELRAGRTKGLLARPLSDWRKEMAERAD